MSDNEKKRAFEKITSRREKKGELFKSMQWNVVVDVYSVEGESGVLRYSKCRTYGCRFYIVESCPVKMKMKKLWWWKKHEIIKSRAAAIISDKLKN